jgi:integrase
VKSTMDAWTAAAAIAHGPVFRAINKAGRVWGDGLSPKVVWDVVRSAAARAGIDKLAPHDLRRTCARLCHLAGGEPDQIQFLLDRAGGVVYCDAIYGYHTVTVGMEKRQR